MGGERLGVVRLFPSAPLHALIFASLSSPLALLSFPRLPNTTFPLLRFFGGPPASVILLYYWVFIALQCPPPFHACSGVPTFSSRKMQGVACTLFALMGLRLILSPSLIFFFFLTFSLSPFYLPLDPHSPPTSQFHLVVLLIRLSYRHVLHGWFFSC